MAEIKAIETFYNGYRFRSRTEARWAVFMDLAGIPYMYEPEGFKLPDGTLYLPDFYLKDQDTFLECKGVMDKKDRHKIYEFAKAFTKENEKEIIIGYPDMKFEIVWCEENNTGHPKLVSCKENWICRCRECGKIFFLQQYYGWQCRCCGYYDGDSGFDVLYNPEPYGENDYMPIIKAKQARFEHGESGIIG